MEAAANRTKKVARIAAATALTATLALISVPIPISPAPISLALVGTLVSATALDARGAALSQLAYLLLGALGVPVFAGFRGGFAVLAGHTGGYIVGYVFCAAIASLAAPAIMKAAGRMAGQGVIGDDGDAGAGQGGNGIVDGSSRRDPAVARSAMLARVAERLSYAIAYAVGIAACYLFGASWMAIASGKGIIDVLGVAVAPFLLGDLLKVALCVAVAPKLRAARAIGA